MPEETSKLCETALNSGRTSCVFNNDTHRFDFNLLSREQMSTNWAHVRQVRKIRRLLIDVTGATGSQPTGSQPTGSQPTYQPTGFLLEFPAGDKIEEVTPGTGSQDNTSSPPVDQSTTEPGWNNCPSSRQPPPRRCRRKTQSALSRRRRASQASTMRLCEPW